MNETVWEIVDAIGGAILGKTTWIGYRAFVRAELERRPDTVDLLVRLVKKAMKEGRL